jgi:methylated-DNA-protein-cysteine methyltransferase-like protein
MSQYDKESFFQAVYEIVRHIPYGRATSYAAIAKAIGYPNLSRMVGRAMGGCNVDIPAHRVVNSQGILTGRASWEDCRKMQQLLESEGICVENHRIKNWEKIFWNPLAEMDL